MNSGVRWEYGSPITELYGRLVNLDIAPGFTAVAPVVARIPMGSLTGMQYPDSLLQPDKQRIRAAHRDRMASIPASSLVVRAGYGLYYNTSVYQSIAQQMAAAIAVVDELERAEHPGESIDTGQRIQRSRGDQPNTFAIDPNFRVGYAQNWQVSVQRDLPGSLVMTVTYLGIKGTRGRRSFCPIPIHGAVNPCPSCPAGFTYMTSNGNSTAKPARSSCGAGSTTAFAPACNTRTRNRSTMPRSAGEARAANVIAQNWLDLSAERGLSNFDQRHLLTFQMQYTTRPGHRRRDAAERMARRAIQRVDGRDHDQRRHRLAPDPDLSLGTVPGTGVTGRSGPITPGAALHRAPGLVPESGGLCAAALGPMG